MRKNIHPTIKILYRINIIWNHSLSSRKTTILQRHANQSHRLRGQIKHNSPDYCLVFFSTAAILLLDSTLVLVFNNLIVIGIVMNSNEIYVEQGSWAIKSRRLMLTDVIVKGRNDVVWWYSFLNCYGIRLYTEGSG